MTDQIELIRIRLLNWRSVLNDKRQRYAPSMSDRTWNPEGAMLLSDAEILMAEIDKLRGAK